MTNSNLPATDGQATLVRLASSPLKRVLCAVYFAPVLRINDATGAGVSTFQDRIRGVYPSVRMEFAHEIELEADDHGMVGDPQIRKSPVWRFIDNATKWRVSLTPQSLALEVDSDYEGRATLMDRFVDLVEALNASFKPVAFKRMGFRFFNLFDGEKLSNIERYIRPEMLGFVNSVGGLQLLNSAINLHLKQGETYFLVKHGFMPAGAQSDMQPIPLESPAWLLDIDSSQSLVDSVGVGDLRSIASEITDSICRFFAWSVTSQFIEDYRHG